jgi:hypothetical protein
MFTFGIGLCSIKCTGGDFMINNSTEVTKF